MRFLCKHCSELIKIKPEEYGTELPCPYCGGQLTAPTKQTDRGALIDDYLMLEPLGEGGFATVYRAHQVSLDRDVALKVVTKDRIEDVMEFVNEARNAFHFVHAVGAVEPQFRAHFQIGRVHGEATVLCVHNQAVHVVTEAAPQPPGLPVLQEEIRAPVQ